MQGFQRGFMLDYIRQNHEFTAKNKTGRLRVNIAVFTDKENCDIDTSAVSVYYEPTRYFSDEVIVEQVALSGSPFIFVARENEVKPYGVNVNGKVRPVPLGDALPYSDVVEFFERYKTDINPNQIKNVKSGASQFNIFTNIHSLQLRLFALDVTRDYLAEVFGYAVNHLRTGIGNKSKQEDTITDIAVRLLGAIILAHKGRLGENYQEAGVPFDRVYQRAADLFPSYFNWQAIEKHLSEVQRAYSSLQQATYSSFTPDMLSELYIQAYPDREKRKLEGRFDTPLFLTRLILENIPLETIRPENRQIADITCGWGSFLIAGYERLSNLSDMKPYSLNNHIMGNDIDSFTAQLARVALLTTALQDNWQVTDGDALDLDPKSFRPTVIVGNPKFSGDRKRGGLATEVDPTTGRSKRRQEANDFLVKAIQLLEPGGYLGMLMPQSFTIGESSSDARKALLSNCDILELWDLPPSIFRGQATVHPMVVFAKKRIEANGPVNFPVRIRVAQGDALQTTRQFTASNVAPSQQNWGEASVKAKQPGATKITHLITYTSILRANQWNEIQNNCIKMMDVAEVMSGIVIGDKKRGRWQDDPSPKTVPWLSDAKSSIPRPFFINYGSKTIVYPNEVEEPGKSKRFPEKDRERLLSSKKVLLSSIRNPSWGSRTKVAIDRRGYYPSNNFWVLVPKDQGDDPVSLEVLAAVLSWDVSNAWVVGSFRYAWIRSQTIKDIPFPHLSKEDSQKIKEAVIEIEKAAEIGKEDQDAHKTIDEILKRAYQLDDDTLNLLRTVMKWENTPRIKEHEDEKDATSWYKVRGQVDGVNGDVETITLWFEAFSGLYTLPITPEIPGWMMRPGTSFVAEVSYDELKQKNWHRLKWRNIKPKNFTYLSEDELIENITLKLGQS